MTSTMALTLTPALPSNPLHSLPGAVGRIALYRPRSSPPGTLASLIIISDSEAQAIPQRSLQPHLPVS